MAKVAELAEPTTPAGGLDELLSSPLRRGRARGAGLRPRTPGPTRHRIAARSPLVPLVVGVDSSTSACKVQVRDVDTGAVVASGRAAHSPTSPPRSEQHPSEWESGIPRRLRRGRPSRRDRPRRHCRRRATARARRPRRRRRGPAARQALERHRVRRRHRHRSSLPSPAARRAGRTACGSVPVPSFTITKLHWLRRCEPETFRRTAAVLLPHDWLTFRLTGRRTTDRGDASGTGLLVARGKTATARISSARERRRRLGRRTARGARSRRRRRRVGAARGCLVAAGHG